jgi:hypothetical protein
VLDVLVHEDEAPERCLLAKCGMILRPKSYHGSLPDSSRRELITGFQWVLFELMFSWVIDKAIRGGLSPCRLRKNIVSGSGCGIPQNHAEKSNHLPTGVNLDVQQRFVPQKFFEATGLRGYMHAKFWTFAGAV